MVSKIGVVDAHPIFRLGIRHLLDDIPDLALIAEAESRSEALTLVSEEKLDVLLPGTNLPQSESITLARQIHEKEVETRVVVLTSHEEDKSLLFDMLAWRAAGYILKTDPLHKLVEVIRHCVSGKSGWISQRLINTILETTTRPLDTASSMLTSRERETLTLIARGYSNQHIAETLCISIKTVKNQITNIYEKLGVEARSGAIAWAWTSGFMLRRD